MRVMPFITIYSRHGVIRTGKNKGKRCPYSGDELHLGCDCRKWLRWTDAVTHKLWRIPAKTRSKEEANAVKISLEKKWRGEEPAPESQGGKLVSEALSLYVESKELEGTGKNTIKRIQTFLNALQKFCDHPRATDKHGKSVPISPALTVDEVTGEFMQHFVKTWEGLGWNPYTRKRGAERFLGFFHYALANKWIREIPIFPMPKVRHEDQSPTLPLSEEDLQKLFDAIPKVIRVKSVRVRVRNLFTLQLNSGLAIVDALMLPKSKIAWSNLEQCYLVETRRTKTNVPVTVPLPSGVAEQILSTPNSNPDYIFWNGKTDRTTFRQNFSDNQVKKVFQFAGLTACHMKSHRIRDTFAVNMLANGVPKEKVAEALGHSLKTFEKHYEKWIPKRQSALIAAIKATFTDPTTEEAERAILAQLKAKWEPTPDQKLAASRSTLRN